MMKRSLSGLLIALLVLSVMGCNTIHGVGKDVESAGRAIQKSSQ
jgi:predicted small secreted protein